MEKKKVQLRVKDIATDPLGDALTDSPDIRPYVEYYGALFSGVGVSDALARVQAIPLEQRYLFRVNMQLDLALADLDTATAALDLQFLPPAKANELVENIRLRREQLELLVRSIGSRMQAQ